MRINARCLKIAGFVLAAGACSRVEENLLAPPPEAPRATAHCLDRSDPDYYFAPGQIDEIRDDSFVRRGWFSNYLRAAGASSLSCGNSSETIRLLWLPASRNARIITIAFRQRGWNLETADFGDALFGGLSSEKPPTLRHSTRVLGRAELEQFRRELARLDFWIEPQYQNGGAEDGWALVVEGRSGDRYRAVTRINFRDGYDFLARTTSDLAGLPALEALEVSKPRTEPRKIPLPLPR
jgi:hypothetical protein